MTGTKSYINGELAGVNRSYREDDDFSGAEPGEAGFTGGTLTQISGLEAVTQTRTKVIYSLGAKKFIQTEYDPDSTEAFEVSKYREVESTGTGMDKVWSFKSGGDIEVFDGTRDDVGIVAPSTADMGKGATFTMTVAVK